MRIHHRAADAGKMLQAQADALRPRHLVCQQRIGFHLGDIGGKGTLDPADIGIFGVVIDIDHRREIIVDAEPAHLGKARGEDRALMIRREMVEFLRTRQRRKAAAFLQPPHQAALLVDEHHRGGRQRGNLRAEALHLFGRFDVVVVLLRPAGIVEQDRAAEAVAGSELLQPRRDGLAEEAEDEEFADLHVIALRHGALSPVRPSSANHRATHGEDTSLPASHQLGDPAVA